MIRLYTPICRKRSGFLESLCLDGVFSLRKVDLSLSLLHSDSRSLKLSQSSSQSSSLLCSQVLWLVLLTLVQLSDSLSLLLVDGGQNTSNVPSDSLNFGQRRSGKLLNLQLS